VAPKSGRVKMMSELIDSMVIPGIQGGPLMHVIAAKAVAFKEALEPAFESYARQVIKNAKALAAALVKFDFNIISGGTDNHLMLIDLRNKKITGKDAEKALEAAGITVNKNAVPFDDQSPLITSGIRIGTPALTTRGMKESEMELIGSWIHRILSDLNNSSLQEKIKKEIKELCQKFPLYR
jgi:glycine hydroxymethyltransferase